MNEEAHIERGSELPEAKRMEAEQNVPGEVDPNESPFAMPPLVTIPLLGESRDIPANEAAIEEAERPRRRFSFRIARRRDSSEA